MADELITLTGFKELAKALRELGPRVAKNALRRSVASGAAVIRNEAKARAPVDTGEMKKDIQIKRLRETRGEMSVKYIVFVRSGKKSRMSGKARNVSKDSFYWRFQEFGTSKMAAHPFMRPALAAKRAAAVDAIKEKLTEGVHKAAAELGRRR